MPNILKHCGIIGLVVEYIVAIDVTRVRFPDDACVAGRVVDELAPARVIVSAEARSRFAGRWCSSRLYSSEVCFSGV